MYTCIYNFISSKDPGIKNSKLDTFQGADHPSSLETSSLIIKITCPCYIYPLIPKFYIGKLRYGAVYMHLFFLFLLQDIDCAYSLEPPLFYNLGNNCILRGHVFVMLE